MSEERKMILKMLKDGKISEDEALKLLDAIGQNDEKVYEGNTTNSFAESTQNLANKIVSGVDKILKKTGEKLNSIDIAYDFDIDLGDSRNYSFSRFKSKTNKRKVIEVKDLESPNLLVNNTNGKIKVDTWDMDYIEVNASVTFNEKYVNESYDFVEDYVNGDNVEIRVAHHNSKKQPFNVDLDIYVPKKRYGNVDVRSTNGLVDVSFVESNVFHGENVNGKLEVKKVIANEVKLESVNGKVLAQEVETTNLDLDCVNGKIEFFDNLAKDISVNNVNGPIVGGMISEITGKLSIESVNAGIELNNLNFERPIRLETGRLAEYTTRLELSEKFANVRKENRKTEATSASYSDMAENKLEIFISTVNGRIKVQ